MLKTSEGNERSCKKNNNQINFIFFISKSRHQKGNTSKISMKINFNLEFSALVMDYIITEKYSFPPSSRITYLVNFFFLWWLISLIDLWFACAYVAMATDFKQVIYFGNWHVIGTCQNWVGSLKCYCVIWFHITLTSLSSAVRTHCLDSGYSISTGLGMRGNGAILSCWAKWRHAESNRAAADPQPSCNVSQK